MSEKRFVKVTPFAVNDTWDNHRPMECASSLDADVVCHYLNEQQFIIEKQEEIIKSQDLEISRQYNLALAMSGVLREEFGVYDVFDRTKDKKKLSDNDD